MIDLNDDDQREALEETISNDIDTWCSNKYFTGHRDHLGASIMGHSCNRHLFYNFRWVKAEKHEGRIQRLFQVGHNAEPRFVEYLTGIGFNIAPLNPETGKQWRISAHNGHYGGSLDGKCIAPERYNLSTNLVLLNEFKTNGTGAGFNNVSEKSLSAAKPAHYKQMCQYGYLEQIEWGLYIIENKNDSALKVKIVHLDWNVGRELVNKAGDIINSKIPPPRVAENPSYFECNYCAYKQICFDNAPVEQNCRSCRFATPVEDGQWHCSQWNSIIPKDAITKGCERHTTVNEQ